jgi:general stress protein 26
MPVWGVWDGESFWFSSSRRSRKATNVAGDSRCVVTTENAVDPVVLEGTAKIVTDTHAIEEMLALLNTRYRTHYELDFLDPDVIATIQVRPRWAFGLVLEDFGGSPTRWIFAD